MKIHLIVTNSGESNVVKNMLPVIQNLLPHVNFSCEGIFPFNDVVSFDDGIFESTVIGFDEYINKNNTEIKCNKELHTMFCNTNQTSYVDINELGQQPNKDDDADTSETYEFEIPSLDKQQYHIRTQSQTVSVESFSQKMAKKFFNTKKNRQNTQTEQLPIECKSMVDQLPLHNIHGSNMINKKNTHNTVFSPLLFPITKYVYFHIFWMEFTNYQTYLDVAKPQITAWKNYLFINNMKNWIIVVIISNRSNEKSSIFKSKSKLYFDTVKEDFDDITDDDSNGESYQSNRVIYINHSTFDSVESNFDKYENLTQSLVLQCVESFRSLIVDESINLENRWNQCREQIASILHDNNHNGSLSTNIMSPSKDTLSTHSNPSRLSPWNINELLSNIMHLTSIYYNAELYQASLDLTIKNCSRLKKYITRFIFDNKKYSQINKYKLSNEMEQFLNENERSYKNERFSVANWSIYGNTIDKFEELIAGMSSFDNEVMLNSSNMKVCENKEAICQSKPVNSKIDMDNSVLYDQYSFLKKFKSMYISKKPVNAKCLEVLGLIPGNLFFSSINTINDNSLSLIHNVVSGCFNKKTAINTLHDLSIMNTDRKKKSNNNCILKYFLSLGTIGLQLFLNIGCIDFAIYFSCDIIYTCQHIITYSLSEKQDAILNDRIRGIFMLECFIRLLQRATKVIDQLSDVSFRSKQYVDNWDELMPSKKSLLYAVAHLLCCIDSCIDMIYLNIAPYSYHSFTTNAYDPLLKLASNHMLSKVSSINSSFNHADNKPHMHSGECSWFDYENKINLSKNHSHTKSLSPVACKASIFTKKPKSKITFYNSNSDAYLFKKPHLSEFRKHLCSSIRGSISVGDTNCRRNTLRSASKLPLHNEFPNESILASYQIFQVSIVKAQSLLKPDFFVLKHDTRLSGDLAFSFINQAHRIYKSINYEYHIHSDERRLLLRFINQNNLTTALELATNLEACFFDKKWHILCVDILFYELQIYFRLINDKLNCIVKPFDEVTVHDTVISSGSVDKSDNHYLKHLRNKLYTNQTHIFTENNQFIISPYIELFSCIESSKELLEECLSSFGCEIGIILAKLVIFGKTYLYPTDLNKLYNYFCIFTRKSISTSHSISQKNYYPIPLLINSSKTHLLLEKILRNSLSNQIQPTSKINFFSNEEIKININVCSYYHFPIDCNKIFALFVNNDEIHNHYGSPYSSSKCLDKDYVDSIQFKNDQSYNESYILGYQNGNNSISNNYDLPHIIFGSESISPIKLYPGHNNNISASLDPEFSVNSKVKCGNYILKEIGFKLNNFYIFTVYNNECDYLVDNYPEHYSFSIISRTNVLFEAKDTNLYMIPKYQPILITLASLLPSNDENKCTVQIVSIDQNLCLKSNVLSDGDTEHKLKINLNQLEKDFIQGCYLLPLEICPKHSSNNNFEKSLSFIDNTENSHSIQLVCDLMYDNHFTQSSVLELYFKHIVSAAMATFPIDSNTAYVHIVCFNVGNLFDIFINWYMLEIICQNNPALAKQILCTPLEICIDNNIEQSSITVPSNDCSNARYLQKCCNYAFLWKIIFPFDWKQVPLNELSFIFHYNISLDKSNDLMSFNFYHKFDNIKF